MYTVNCIKYSKPRDMEIGNVNKFSIFVIKTLDARFLTLIKQSYSLNAQPKGVAFFPKKVGAYDGNSAGTLAYKKAEKL